jgi:hypothetical protein
LQVVHQGAQNHRATSCPARSAPRSVPPPSKGPVNRRISGDFAPMVLDGVGGGVVAAPDVAPGPDPPFPAQAIARRKTSAIALARRTLRPRVTPGIRVRRTTSSPYQAAGFEQVAILRPWRGSTSRTSTRTRSSSSAAGSRRRWRRRGLGRTPLRSPPPRPTACRRFEWSCSRAWMGGVSSSTRTIAAGRVGTSRRTPERRWPSTGRPCTGRFAWQEWSTR